MWVKQFEIKNENKFEFLYMELELLDKQEIRTTPQFRTELYIYRTYILYVQMLMCTNLCYLFFIDRLNNPYWNIKLFSIYEKAMSNFYI